MSRVRVGANLCWIVPGVVGGSEEYTVGMLRALARRRDRLGINCELKLYINRRFAQAHPDLCEAWPTAVMPITGRSKAARVAVESTWMSAVARRDDLAVLHHMGGLVPLGAPGHPVLTLHDLQPLLIPEHFGAIKQRFHRVALPWSVRNAERIVTLSQYTKTEVCARFDVDPARVRVLPPGNAETASDPGPAEVQRVRWAYGLGERPYFLYPAITYPHKNHELLVRALRLVTAEHPEALLVLTGGRASAETQLAAAVRDAGVIENLRRPGRVPRADLDALYGGATAVTFPSRFEGFGLPVLEAMRRGCPVLAADETALPEVVGSGGILLGADDPQEWSRAMTEMLQNPAARQSLADAGRARAGDFSWRRSAEGLAELWAEVGAR